MSRPRAYLRPCGSCGRPCGGQLCAPCRRVAGPATPRRKGLSNSWAERQRRKRVVDSWRAAYGNWCPGYAVPGHPAAKLSADHVHEVHAGGHEAGPLQVLCVACNSRKSMAVRRGDGPEAPTTGSRSW